MKTGYQALLALMRADDRAAPAKFQAGEFWRAIHERIDPFLDIGLEDVEAGLLNTHFSNVTQSDPRLYSWFLTTYYRLLKERDKLGLFDRFEATTPRKPKYRVTHADGELRTGTAIEIDGRLLSPDFLFTIRDFYNALEACPDIATKPVVVAEIGAGWGRFGWLLLRVNPSATYAVFDLPETLIVSTLYLPTLLPDIPAKTYEETRGMNALSREMLKEAGLWFFGSHALSKIERGSVDLFVNVSSFQEMEPEIVNGYLTEIDRCVDDGALYSFNMKCGVMSGLADFRPPVRWRELFNREPMHASDHYEAAYLIKP